MSAFSPHHHHGDASLPAEPPQTRRNIKLRLEYDGSRYHGWQRQRNALTIQEVLETALQRLTQEAVRVHGSGRTDAGVHARGQVAHFHTGSRLPLTAFGPGLNSLLPPDIAVLEASEAPPDFHARYDAWAKTYAYRILNLPIRSPLHRGYCWQVPRPLNLAAMAAATIHIRGDHDFTSFQVSGSSVRYPVRRVMAADWEEYPGGWLIFRVQANGFLRGMVRALVGTLAEVGWGKRQPEEMVRLLAARDRRLAGPTAPAAGLFLEEVQYGPGEQTEAQPSGKDSANTEGVHGHRSGLEP